MPAGSARSQRLAGSSDDRPARHERFRLPNDNPSAAERFESSITPGGRGIRAGCRPIDSRGLGVLYGESRSQRVGPRSAGRQRIANLAERRSALPLSRRSGTPRGGTRPALGDAPEAASQVQIGYRAHAKFGATLEHINLATHCDPHNVSSVGTCPSADDHDTAGGGGHHGMGVGWSIDASLGS